MIASLHRPRQLPNDGIGALLCQKREVQDEAQGRLSEPLVQATLQTVARMAQTGATQQALQPRIWGLVREVLDELARKRWKPSETLLLLRPGSAKSGNGRHGTSQ